MIVLPYGARPGILALAVAVAAVTTLPMAHAQGAAPRERISLNSDWRFARGDPPTAAGVLAYQKIRTWMMSTGENLVEDADAVRHPRPEGSIGDDVPYTRPDFDDSRWRRLDLPHDWGIEGPFDIRAQSSTGKLPYAGVGWYRKHLGIPASDRNKRFSLDIDGAMSYSNVWINGHYAGGWAYGYSSFRVDLSSFILPGADNVLAIRLDNPDQSSRWYPGGGIYRNVWLVATGSVHVGQYGTIISTPEVSSSNAEINLGITIDNDSASDAKTTVSIRVFELDADDRKGDNAVANVDPFPVSVFAGKSTTTAARTSIPNPRLWDTRTPNRYMAVVNIERDGRLLDSCETSFGIRSLKFDPAKGFLLNDQHVRLNGVCDHQDLGALGTALNYRALQRQLETLKEMGCNAIRTSHNPPAPELLDLADKMGFLVLDEAFDCWVAQKTPNDYHLLFPDWSEKDLRNMVRRDRNHPSVVMWSIGNEVREQGRPEGRAIGTRLARIVHQEDSTRPVTAACDNLQAGFNGFQDIVDVFGYNYYRADGMYERFHDANPTRMLLSTESASTISSRGEYAFPPASSFDRKDGGALPGPQPQMSSYDLYAPPWATTPDTEFGAQDRSPFVAGEFVWTGWDYLGEPTHNTSLAGGGPGLGGGPSDPARSSYFGIIDLAGFKKDRFYLYQARWRPELPMAHILPHWNWPERVGAVVPVHVYTSGDSAELFLNGKSLGRKTRSRFEYRLRWDDVRYEPGELKVVAYKEGRAWAEDVVKTTGSASRLVLEPDRDRIQADGTDLSFITVRVVDDAGLVVPRSNDLLTLEISGPGDIAAADNGDPTSLVSFRAQEMKTFNGLCLVIIRARTGQPGRITLKARSARLLSAEVTLTTTAK
jgi:beta-galactosidase